MVGRAWMTIERAPRGRHERHRGGRAPLTLGVHLEVEPDLGVGTDLGRRHAGQLVHVVVAQGGDAVTEHTRSRVQVGAEPLARGGGVDVVDPEVDQGRSQADHGGRGRCAVQGRRHVQLKIAQWAGALLVGQPAGCGWWWAHRSCCPDRPGARRRRSGRGGGMWPRRPRRQCGIGARFPLSGRRVADPGRGKDPVTRPRRSPRVTLGDVLHERHDLGSRYQTVTFAGLSWPSDR